MTQIEEAWEYAEADTQYHVHGLHSYPARMIPQIANRLIQMKSKPGELVLDPFCGSGGVLVESLLAGRNAIGVDINPLAHLIALVKTTSLELQTLAEFAENLLAWVRKDIYSKGGNAQCSATLFQKHLSLVQEECSRGTGNSQECDSQDCSKGTS